MARVKNWGAAGIEPSAAKLNGGWQEGERPPAEYFNWLFNQTTTAINGLDDDVTALQNRSSVKSATLIVGTTASGHTASEVDYLCDGTADDVQINAAIQALPTGGGKIVIREGTYDISAAIVVNKINVVIKGMGSSTCLVRSFSAGSLVPSGVFEISGDDVTIALMKIKGQYIGNAVPQGDMSYGIWVKNGGDYARITNIDLEKHRMDPIHIGESGCVVENCRVSYTHGSGIAVVQGPAIIERNEISICSHEGIRVDSYYVRVLNNFLANNAEGDICVDDNMNYNIVSGNHCRSAINISLKGPQLLVTNNMCYGQTTTIQATSNANNCLITGNIMFGTNITNAGTNNTVANNKYMA